MNRVDRDTQGHRGSLDLRVYDHRFQGLQGCQAPCPAKECRNLTFPLPRVTEQWVAPQQLWPQ
jgi:hypothetical protein